MRRKSKIPRFEIWNSVVVTSGVTEKNLNRCEQLQIIPYKKPQKHFFKLHGLIAFRWAKTVVLPSIFGTTSMNLIVWSDTL